LKYQLAAFESFNLIHFHFFSIAWMIDYILVVSSRFVFSLLVSVLLAEFENSKLINFDRELCIRKFEANQFQFFQHYRDNEICSG
jgi:hypothetical protein